MEYIDISWLSGGPGEPHRLVSEIDEQRFETRKIEFFSSGEVGSASDTHETARTSLGTLAVPPLSEVNDDAQFAGVELPQIAFEHLWRRYGRTLELYEVVQLIGRPSGVPEAILGKKVVVLLAYEETRSFAYEVECVAEDGGTLWLGTVAREYLRAEPHGAA